MLWREKHGEYLLFQHRVPVKWGRLWVHPRGRKVETKPPAPSPSPTPGVCACVNVCARVNFNTGRDCGGGGSFNDC